MTAANGPLGGATPSKKRTNQNDPDAAFAEIVDRAIAERAGIGGPGAPLADDPDPMTLVRYAAGSLEGEARADVEASLARSTWAYRCVLALVRHSKTTPARTPADLPHHVARSLLRAAREKRGAIPVVKILTDAFTEAGAAVAASTTSDPRTREFSGVGDALRRNDGDEALAQAISALVRAAPPGQAII